MIIEMSKKEFQEMRKFLMGLNNQKANKQFNAIFDKKPTGEVRGFVNPLNQTVVIEISETATLNVESTFVKHAPDIGKMVKGGVSITTAPKWFAIIKNIFTDICAAFTKK